MQLNKYDYYYGAFLSKLVSKGIVPALLEEGKERRIYQLGTKSRKMKVYSKYATSTGNTWNFRFSDEELLRIEAWNKNREDMLIVLICSSKDLLGGEIAVLTLDELITCTVMEKQYKEASSRAAVRRKKHSPFLYVYGTALSLDDALKVERDFSARLEPQLVQA